MMTKEKENLIQKELLELCCSDLHGTDTECERGLLNLKWLRKSRWRLIMSHPVSAKAIQLNWWKPGLSEGHCGY